MRWLVWLWVGCVWLWGCQREGEKSKASKIRGSHGGASLCQQEGILGWDAVVGGRCVREEDCGAEKAAWRRCVAGRCVVAGEGEGGGHQAAVRAAVFLSERVIASADDTGMIWLWRRDGLRWRSWHGWKGHAGPIMVLERGPAGYVLSGGVGSVRVWELRRRALVAEWRLRGEVQALAWSEARQMIAVTSTDRVVRWRRWPRDGEMWVDEKEGKGWLGEAVVCDVVRSLAWEVGETGRLAGGGDDGLLYVWDILPTSQRATSQKAERSSKQKATSQKANNRDFVRVERWRGHRGWVRRVGWWGKQPVTVGFDGTLRVWNVRTGRSIRLGAEGPVLPLVLGRVKKCLASVNPRTSIERVVWKDRWLGGDPLGMTLFPKRGLVAVGAHREGWLRWPDAQGSEVVVWSLAGSRVRCRIREHRLGVRVVARSPEEMRFVSGSEDGTLRVYRLP